VIQTFVNSKILPQKYFLFSFIVQPDVRRDRHPLSRRVRHLGARIYEKAILQLLTRKVGLEVKVISQMK
jgi:hypothetical protein